MQFKKKNQAKALDQIYENMNQWECVRVKIAAVHHQQGFLVLLCPATYERTGSPKLQMKYIFSHSSM